jgi:hypothetical protein
VFAGVLVLACEGTFNTPQAHHSVRLFCLGQEERQLKMRPQKKIKAQGEEREKNPRIKKKEQEG